DSTRVHVAATFAKWQFVKPRGSPTATEIESRESTLQLQIIVVRRGQRLAVCRSDAAAIIDRFAVREGTQQREAVSEALLYADLQSVVGRVRRCIHVLHATEQRKRARQVRVGISARDGVVVGRQSAQFRSR